MLPPLPTSWRPLLETATAEPTFKKLDSFLDQELAQQKQILPARTEIYRALELTPPDRVKVLLLGQDPYPTPGHAHGLCFSVQASVRPLPGSLRNVFKELQADVGFRIPNNGFLESWARQGMLMLNTVLTLEARRANSHAKHGWEPFTDRIIQTVAARPTRVVFLLWGASAHKKAKWVTQPHHRIIQCAHPSPLSAKKFLGCRCFSQTNRELVDGGLPPIDWQISDV